MVLGLAVVVAKAIAGGREGVLDTPPDLGDCAGLMIVGFAFCELTPSYNVQSDNKV